MHTILVTISDVIGIEKGPSFEDPFYTANLPISTVVY